MSIIAAPKPGKSSYLFGGGYLPVSLFNIGKINDLLCRDLNSARLKLSVLFTLVIALSSGLQASHGYAGHIITRLNGAQVTFR